ncbi:MAG TPA: glycosyltransferase family 2 protein [Thermomicrobiaceae bacterium]|nr:glycosyltransferase family 2 protein [Thermomicrobiaceae bacterium]
MISGKLSLVLPAHNEFENLPVVVERALAVLPELTEDFELVVVDDGSVDGTAALADELAARYPQVTVVHHPRNRGYGAALTSGFETASGDRIMFMDADRQFDIADLSFLAPFVADHDIVAGYRLARQDAAYRRIYASIFKLAVRILFGIRLRDIDCAFKVFRADLLRDAKLESPGALINTEILAKARVRGASWIEVGVNHYPRGAGTSSGGSPKVVFRAMRETILLWWRMRRYHPAPAACSATSARPNLLLGAVIALGVTTLAAAGGLATRLARRRRP